MYPRPKWAGTVYFWLTDIQFDYIARKYPDDNWRWEVHEWINIVGVKALCLIFGHHPGPDQCNKPEHDLCNFCNKRMPYQAERPFRSQ